jgi:hypothetical protein
MSVSTLIPALTKLMDNTVCRFVNVRDAAS